MQDKSRKNNWSNFLKLCANLKTEKQFSDIFSLFLTHAEHEDIALRFAIMSELLNGERTQREIAKKLKISVAKVSRGANALKIVDTQLKNRLSKIIVGISQQ